MPMDSFPACVTLRDGTEVTLTPLQPADSGALWEFYRDLPEEDRLVLRDEAVVGEASLYRTLHGWTRHVGELRINVGPGFRRKGLASALAAAQVQLATDLGIEKIIVQVVDNQLAARRTFERLGFHKEAVLPHHVMDINGVKRDLLLRYKSTEELDAMRALKSAFDPKNILNPGKVFDLKPKCEGPLPRDREQIKKFEDVAWI